MSDDYAEACALLEECIDSAGNRVSHILSNKEIAAELRRIADGWENNE